MSAEHFHAWAERCRDVRQHRDAAARLDDARRRQKSAGQIVDAPLPGHAGDAGNNDIRRMLASDAPARIEQSPARVGAFERPREHVCDAIAAAFDDLHEERRTGQPHDFVCLLLHVPRLIARRPGVQVVAEFFNRFLVAQGRKERGLRAAQPGYITPPRQDHELVGVHGRAIEINADRFLSSRGTRAFLRSTG